jgi:hypothetical protein
MDMVLAHSEKGDEHKDDKVRNGGDHDDCHGNDVVHMAHEDNTQSTQDARRSAQSLADRISMVALLDDQMAELENGHTSCLGMRCLHCMSQSRCCCSLKRMSSMMTMMTMMKKTMSYSNKKSSMSSIFFSRNLHNIPCCVHKSLDRSRSDSAN